MINGITQGGRYITVSGGSGSNPYISPGAVGAGMLRWNPNMNCMEVSDGNIWKTLSMDYASVSLTPEAESLLDWARKKQTEEQNLEAMLEKYPGLKKAKENFDLMLNIVKDDYAQS
jgi:hypothetical protein